MNVESIAKICHETNRSYCEAIGDTSQKPWTDSPDWQKQSAINGVKYHLANPNAGPSGSHQNWFAEKAAAGWTFGTTKDAEKKEHPCMVPYEQLPAAQRAKDALFVGIVHALKDVNL